MSRLGFWGFLEMLIVVAENVFSMVIFDGISGNTSPTWYGYMSEAMEYRGFLIVTGIDGCSSAQYMVVHSFGVLISLCFAVKKLSPYHPLLYPFNKRLDMRKNHYALFEGNSPSNSFAGSILQMYFGSWKATLQWLISWNKTVIYGKSTAFRGNIESTGIINHC